MTMGPLGRGKGRRLFFLGTLHVIGAVLGGSLIGSILGGLGTLFSLSLWRPGFLGVVGIFAIWQCLSRRPARLGFYWQQVPRHWQYTMSDKLRYLLWGVLLGSEVATLIPYSSLLVVLVAQLTSGVTLGGLSGLLFGGTRELVALLPLLKKQYRQNPPSAVTLLPGLSHLVRKLNIVLTIIGSLLLFLTCLH